MHGKGMRVGVGGCMGGGGMSIAHAVMRYCTVHSVCVVQLISAKV